MFMRELEDGAKDGFLHVEKLFYAMQEEERENHDFLGNIVFYNKLIDECDIVVDVVKDLMEKNDIRGKFHAILGESFYTEYNPLIKILEEKINKFNFFANQFEILANKLEKEIENSPVQKILAVSKELRDYSYNKYYEIEHTINVSFEEEEFECEKCEFRSKSYQNLYVLINVINPPQELINLYEKCDEINFSLYKLCKLIIGTTKKYLEMRWLADLYRKSTDLGLLDSGNKEGGSEQNPMNSPGNTKDYSKKPPFGKKSFVCLCILFVIILTYSTLTPIRHKVNNAILFFIPPTLNSLAVSNILTNITDLSRPKISSVRKSSIDKGDYAVFSRNLSPVFPVESTMYLLKQCEAGQLNCQSGIPLDVLVEMAKSRGKLDVLQRVINNKMGDVIGIGISPHYVFVVGDDGNYILKK